ncbi:hypothetical protein N0V90_005989 [Kalmusia sp. IMI 367209]|nr:hypothetical protein N0V90_005989 [Kalmusia sp. IMI 367209]
MLARANAFNYSIANRKSSDVVPEQGLGFKDDDIGGKIRPMEDINSEAMACGREALRAAKTTQTADVHPGTPLGFNIEHDYYNTESGFDYIFHIGPAQIYLARAPNEDLSMFNGTDGKWFKIASVTAAHDTQPNPDYWITYRQRRVNFTIPDATPPGKYLLRIEHFMSGDPAPQWYINCAHVNVLGGGTGVIPESAYAMFPGSYKLDDPSIKMDYSIWNKPGALLNYVGPGPKIWNGKVSPTRKTSFIA